MAKRIRRPAVWQMTTVLLASPAVHGQAMVTTTGAIPGGMQIANGELRVDGETVLPGLSVTRTRAGFLFFYLPGDGLWIVSPESFEGAAEAGAFDGPQLDVEHQGRRVQLESATPILGSERVAAWIRHDADFVVDVDSPLFGYGDRETDADAWPDRLRTR